MSTGYTTSEKFVASLCEHSFLSLWTHPNPIGKNGKELCDCLVVCGPHIVIVSVKENEYKDTRDITGFKRWQKAAIEKSVAQIWGAERWLTNVDRVTRHDGREVSLPEKSERKYHRISVSLGGKGKVPLAWGDFGNGFVHVCDEFSVDVLFKSLDTITDFVEFLDSVEALVGGDKDISFAGGGLEDLIALYLSYGYSFDFNPDVEGLPDDMVITSGIWDGFQEDGSFEAMQESFEDSYMWDRLINHYTDDLLTDGMFDMHSKEVTKDEHALIEMALQPRAVRASLAKAFSEFLMNPELKIASRVAYGYSSTAFVFLIGKSSDRDFRTKELHLRCLVVRGRLSGIDTVVGIAIDRPGTSEVGYSSDIYYAYTPKWTSEDEELVAGIQADLGYFKDLGK